MVIGLESMRAWRNITRDPFPQSAIRVFQYNILAESLVQFNIFASGEGDEEGGSFECPSHLREPGSAGMHYCNELDRPSYYFRAAAKHLAWQHRFPLILNDILAHSPDVVCLQEVDRFEDFRFALKTAGYEGTFCKKDGKFCKDGNAVFWKVAKFPSWRSKHIKLLPKNFMKALFVRLTMVSGARIVVCSTHLKAGFDREDQRLEQATSLVQRLERFAGDDPTILCGDLNAHYSPLCLCSSETCCDPTRMFKAKVIPMLLEAGFRNAYGSFPSFTCWAGYIDREVKATFDYIFIRGSVRALSVLDVPCDEQVAQLPTRLPNDTYPSDHVYLVADIVCTSDMSSSQISCKDCSGADVDADEVGPETVRSETLYG